PSRPWNRAAAEKSAAELPSAEAPGSCPKLNARSRPMPQPHLHRPNLTEEIRQGLAMGMQDYAIHKSRLSAAEPIFPQYSSDAAPFRDSPQAQPSIGPYLLVEDLPRHFRTSVLHQ